MFGGQITTTETIDNYPGFPEGVTGDELSRLMEEQAKRFGMETVREEVEVATLDGDRKLVRTTESTYLCKALIICTGAEYRKLGVPGEKEFAGTGVSYCATCDGAFFKDNKIIVVGGGDSALTEALFLTKFVEELTIIHRRMHFGPQRSIRKKPWPIQKSSFSNSVVQEIKGDEVVRAVVVKNVKTGQITEFPTEGAFLFVGLLPRTQFLKGLVQTDEAGYIITNDSCETSVKVIFAAVDRRKKLLRQIATSVGDGATASFAAEKYLEEKI